MAEQKINKIVFAGEGGQGIQVLSKVLSTTLAVAGYDVSYIPQFGPEQRGAPSVAFVQYSNGKIFYPKFSKADILIVLRKRAIKAIESFIGPETTIIFDSSTIPRNLIKQKGPKVFGLPATKLAKENFKPKALNIIVLGVLAGKFFNLGKQIIWSGIEKQLGTKFAKSAELRKVSKEAMEYGFDFSLENKKFSPPIFDTHGSIIVEKGWGKTAVIIPKFCKGCGICILKCPVSALKFGKTLGVYGTSSPDIDLEKCIACDNCFQFCPDSAIRVEKNS